MKCAILLFSLLLMNIFYFKSIYAPPPAAFQDGQLAMNGASLASLNSFLPFDPIKNVNGFGEENKFLHPLQRHGLSLKEIQEIEAKNERNSNLRTMKEGITEKRKLKGVKGGNGVSPELLLNVHPRVEKVKNNGKVPANSVMKMENTQTVEELKAEKKPAGVQKSRRELAVVNTNMGTSGFHGLNWADPRDNYANDEIVLSGLSREFDYKQTKEKAIQILKQFKEKAGANTVRMPINPTSALTDWWNTYSGAIDAAVDMGYSVLIGYWEGPGLQKDGRIDDMAKWKEMWQKVIGKYAAKDNVLFEPMNEPFGYAVEDWVKICIEFLDDHQNVPRQRIVISGKGWNDNVALIGAVKELEGTLLSQHFYTFFAVDPKPTTIAEWEDRLAKAIGPYAGRTIIDEAGCQLNLGLDFQSQGDGNVITSYFDAVTKYTRENGVGLIYWPGLRTDDTYSIFRQDAQGNLVANSESGLAQLKSGWVNGRGGGGINGVNLFQNSAANVLKNLPSKKQLLTTALGALACIGVLCL